MNKIVLGQDGKVVKSPLTITRPTHKNYREQEVCDAYLQEIDDKYCITLVVRITADTVRKYNIPFSSKQEAITYLYSLSEKEDVESSIQSNIVTTPATQEEKKLTADDMSATEESTNKAKWSFEDDTINRERHIEATNSKRTAKTNTETTTTIKRKNFEFGDDDVIRERNEMQKLKDMPIKTRETGTSAGTSTKLSNGIF